MIWDALYLSTRVYKKAMCLSLSPSTKLLLRSAVICSTLAEDIV